MFLKTFALVCIFIIRLRFPSSKSISNTLRSRYGDTIVKKVCKFEKLDFKRRKVQLDINFLETCCEQNVFPRFLQFRTSNSKLKASDAYTDCQKRLLLEEIKNKKKRLAILDGSFKPNKR